MSFWNEISTPIVGLSPMDGVTDASFRYIAATVGRPDVMLTEFVSVDTAAFAPESLLRDFTYSEVERPVAAQIYGHTPEAFYKVAHIVCELGFDGLDINMGCPAKKVAAKGSGAGLIQTPALARAIIRAARQGIRDWAAGQTLADIGVDRELIARIRNANRLRSGAETPAERREIPLSVKTRIGYEVVVVEDWIKNLLEERPAAISIHGRTLMQQYRGSADWGAIARAVEVARGSGTLILGNGDLRSLADVYRRVTETGVDGVLLGRAAQGNPWIFRGKLELKDAVRSVCADAVLPPPVVDLDERFKVLLAHCRHFAAWREPHVFVAMRKQLASYIRAVPRAADMRYRMVRVNALEDVERCLDDYAAALATESFPLRASWDSPPAAALRCG
ncbi:MAG TPA: tRNA-dihydrouridine synthase [Candidatus Binatia bacterium]|jgi:tRNA-dihydrouridine synthase